LCKSALSVDALSNGRMLLGVGVGANEKEFSVLGLDIHQRGRVADERLAIMSRILSGETLTHKGRFHQFEDVAIGPPPVQTPRLPIWVGAYYAGKWADGALRRAAKYGDVFIPAEASIDAYKEAKGRITSYAEDQGRDPSDIQWAMFLWVIMDKSKETAELKANIELKDRLQRKKPLKHGLAAAAGTPDECIELIRQYVDIGITHFILDSASPAEEIVEQYQRMAEEIVPQFK